MPHRRDTRADVDDAVSDLPDESIGDSLRSVEVGRQKAVLTSITGLEADASVVNQRVEADTFHLLSGIGDGFVVTNVDNKELDVGARMLGLDVLNSFIATLFIASSHVDFAAVIGDELTAKSKADSSVATSDENSFLVRFHITIKS